MTYIIDDHASNDVSIQNDILKWHTYYARKKLPIQGERAHSLYNIYLQYVCPLHSFVIYS